MAPARRQPGIATKAGGDRQGKRGDGGDDECRREEVKACRDEEREEKPTTVDKGAADMAASGRLARGGDETWARGVNETEVRDGDEKGGKGSNETVERDGDETETKSGDEET